MKQVDLDPNEYTVRGGKEPILLKGWWRGILLFVFVVLFGAFVMKPLFEIVRPWVRSLLGD